jgi:hypothetical protein
MDQTETLLREAMRREVAAVTAPAPLVERLVAGRPGSSRRRWLGVAVAASVVALAAAVAVPLLGGERDTGAGPATSARPAPGPVVPVFVPGYVPPGYVADRRQPEVDMLPGDRGQIWSVRRNYRGSSMDDYFAVTTMSGAVDRTTLASVRRDYPDAVEVRIGGRVVIHVGRAGAMLNMYEWTERPGVDVDVVGSGEVTDAALRQVIQNLVEHTTATD